MLDFVVGGAQKAGTSSLDAMLRTHPEIRMARVKETHFFDDESRDWGNPDYRELDSFFPAANLGTLRGEATPVTFYWRPALRRLATYNPGIRLILVLRDPVERAFSQWRMERARGAESLSFSNAIRSGRARVQAEPEGLHRLFSYVERGLYSRQLDYVLSLFPASQIHVEVFEELIADHDAVLGRISRFLGIGRFPPHAFPHEHIGSASCPMSDRDRAFLTATFSEDVGRLAAFCDRTPAWQPMPLRRFER